MGKILDGFLLPLLLLIAGLLNWSLISFTSLVASLILRFTSPKTGFRYRGRVLSLWFIFIYSALVIISQVIFLILCAILDWKWTVAGAWWIKLIGLMNIESWRSPTVIYFLVVQLLAGLVAFFEINRNRFGFIESRDSCWGRFSSLVEQIGYRLRLVCCLLLPVVQLASGISNPSWLSLPFFICSCVGLVDWSLTSNFLGLFRWWKLLWVYAGFNIGLLYVYQLPVWLPQSFQTIADSIGLYKASVSSDWQEICSGISLMVFYYMLSFVKHDLEDMEFMMSMREGSLTEQLLPSRNSLFVRQLRSGVRHTNILLRGKVFRFFSINWFTYGFPVSLFALSYWSFHFASICAFALLAYVGYVLYVFPSLFWLHRLNGLLLVFILLWAVSTYVFNVAFAYVNWKLGKDMEIWEMVGLWHYPIPGFFLLAQFCLGILVALGNLVNNSVFLCQSNEERQLSDENRTEEVKEDTKVLIVATIAWGLRKCSRPIMLLLIFLIAAKPGLVHAVYMIFFFAYLLSHEVNKKMRRCLILLCEAHFAALYVLQLSLVSRILEQKGSISMEVLSELGLVESDSTWEFLEIALLACLCAVHNHGFDMLFSFSAIVQHTPCLPIGFGILKAGLNKSVLLSVYATSNVRDRDNNSHERRVALYLSAIGEKFLSIYRSFGTYIAFLTILFTVYLVRPNYISFGYIFLLLIWIIGRQLVERTKQRLWFPLKAYAIVVFIFIYILSIFPTFEAWMSKKVNLYVCFGYNSDASLLENLWESLAIVIVMQLYSYERRQSKYMNLEDADPLQFGIWGFIKRFLIWHSQKILFVALFYASLSPISAFGFLYILGLILSSALPKASKIPSKSFLIYTGFLVSTEYLYQMWGKQAKMFPGQKHHDLSLFLGLQVYRPSFEGLEAGLRAKVLVIAACILQYNVFHWLERMHSSLSNEGRSEEPCPLFVSEEDLSTVVLTPNGDNDTLSESGEPSPERIKSNSWSSFRHVKPSQDLSPGSSFNENGSSRKFSFGYIWGSIKESHKWNKKRVVSLRQERFEMQKTMLKVYLKFWTENMFNLFGLEINMIALLLASFALLNAMSMLYIASLATCVLLTRPIIRKLWPMFVVLFAIILLSEYFAMWSTMMPLSQHVSTPTDARCHDCWKISSIYFHYCEMCWLGIIVDDPRMLISYYVVFMLACFKLRADRASGFSWSSTYNQMVFQRKNAFVWRDISFETKSMWTILDYLRVYCYCHLLDLVLTLILITGTLEYDILHLGYLCFALSFFRMRLTILKKKNKIFKYLRVYNFAVIVLSLAYQSPFVGDFTAGKCETVDYIYEVIGFYKYDYGFRITSRSALVEIIIFVLVSCQSYMFSSSEFDYVFRYLEAEQIGAIVREQEKKATWKTEQLQHIRESEEKKRQRNLQVEKMKAEMLNLQIQLHSTAQADSSPANNEGLRRRKDASLKLPETDHAEKQDGDINTDSVFPSFLYESPRRLRAENPFTVEFTKQQMDASTSEITELRDEAGDNPVNDSDEAKKGKRQSKENHLASAVQLIGDGVSQVQSIGNQAVSSLVSFLNISPEDSDSNEPPYLQEGHSGDERSTNNKQPHLSSSSSMLSDKSRTSGFASWQIGRIIRHIWSQMRSNNDVVCYCCFILVFLWNFSLLSMVYLAALFLYALCVNTGPNYIFWVTMLIYTEIYILVQYLYQITIQHCGFSIQSDLLRELGFPTKKITSAFVISLLPLFLVYLFTLIQSSITAKDGEWFSVGFGNGKGGALNREWVQTGSSWSEKARKFFQLIKRVVITVVSNCCRYWKSLTQEAESPPYFIQLSMDVKAWPEDGIQPERIESGINQLLQLVHDETCKNEMPNCCPCASKVQIRSIERSSENPSVALAVFEVVYVSSLTDCRPAEQFKSLTPASDITKEILKAQQRELTYEVGFPYHIISVIGGGRREIDLYAYIFGADLIVFFLVAIFYQSVIKNKSEFLEYYQLEDQFPKEYVFILMIIFFLIVVDRVIYLCSFATGKVIFYIFSIFLFTYAVTEYAWDMDTSQQNTAGLALRAIYLTKAVSLALQAMQIRYGVPHQSTLYRQFLTSEVSRVNYLGYRLYRALPFLYELRCVLDWSSTVTSLTMYDWLKLEDINASLYLVKCDNVLNRASHKPGERQTKMTKFCNGICLFFILICVIWAPMLMYSSGNPTNIANPINDASFQFDIKTTGGRLILYQTTLCEILPWDKVKSDDLDPQQYLDSYNVNDIQLICCQADASSLWLVPGVVQKQFIQSLYSAMDMKFAWILTRDRPKGKEKVKYDKNVDPSDLPKPSEVEGVLNGSFDSFRVYNIYPRIFRVTGAGEVRPFDQESFVNADLVLHHEEYEWWSFQDINPPDADACGGLSGPMAVIVSEETPQGFLGETLSKFSIWGLYITFVLAVGRFIRMQCSDLRMRIPFENLPSCDRLIAICEDIYAARAEGELGVEEVLYWTLVKIYRSPHMLLEYTKPD
ncbi:piezo-type mechanosensitive ion channel component [Perilla frutescens var. hirtella]|uniref:Piezo-type mechanosensitive ion channel component n=1 Tax=Perilla frutescens var. hirtella TaxID=608512 RepID=A0AAD4P6J9_PERFH|nr:piezo-type mechanosensitive ion channel component [Perilla frutescens var. hirtella]